MLAQPLHSPADNSFQWLNRFLIQLVGSFYHHFFPPFCFVRSLIYLFDENDNILTSTRPKTDDVGLLKLSKSLTFNNNVKPIKLAESNTVVPTGTKCWVSGWGDTQDPNIESFDLRGVEILVLDYNKCKASYDKIPKEVVEERVGPVHICAGYDDGKKDCKLLL